ncbi:S-adenosyl-L-methionine-dependent methyltransferase [Xylaria sp. FL1777]|nr:S-adenosyl-L-methionine-dependent methyltransferase [Xylaria sp. FL1777]
MNRFPPLSLRGFTGTRIFTCSERTPLAPSPWLTTSIASWSPQPRTAAGLSQRRNDKQAIQTPLQVVAARITAHADKLAALAKELSHPPRSLTPSPHSPASLLPRNAPASARGEQLALRDTLTEATLLVTDANEFIPELSVRNNQFACLRWLCRFDIPNQLPLDAENRVDNESSADDLPPFRSLPYPVVAKAAGVPEHQLRSIARMAMLLGFLSEPVPNQVAHSPLSAAMVRQHGLLDWARFVTNTSAPMVSAMVGATETWGDNRSIRKTAYAAAWQTDLPLFAHVAANPELQASYAAYMRAMTQSEGMSIRHLIDGWREGWASLAQRGAVLVDVGGSTGHASLALARAFPGIKAVVQDRAEVLERARDQEASNISKEGLKIEFQPCDFFRAQPPRPPGYTDEGKGDVYFLRQILHDWGDADSIVILRHIATALERSGPHGRLVVMDTVLPPPGVGSRTEEALVRARDLTMQQAHNAHERSREEWERLLAEAHPGLRIKQIIQPFRSLMAVIEIAYKSVL